MKKFFKADVVPVKLEANEIRTFKVDPKITQLIFNCGNGSVQCLPRPVFDEIQNGSLPTDAKNHLRYLWTVNTDEPELEFDTSKLQYDEYVLVNGDASVSSVLIERQFLLI